MAPRRSTRRAGDAAQGDAQGPTADVDSASPSGATDVQSESEEEAPKRKKAKTSGKALNTGTQASAPKKQRGSRGLLKDVVDMPLDIVFEIFARLLPGDLLSLAQTSKDLRRILMSRSSASIWRDARANEPGLPDSPPDLNEPQYANLCFGKHCMNCDGGRVNALHTSWNGRLRLCKPCIQTLCSRNYVDNGHRIYDYQTRSILPFIPLKKSSRGRAELWYLKEPVDEWVRIRALGSPAAPQYQQGLLAKHLHGKACAVWFEGRQMRLSDEKASTIEQNRALVVQHARSMGWEEEFDSPFGYGLTAIQSADVITKACTKTITSRVLSNLEKTINDIMEVAKEDRLEAVAEELLRQRLEVYKHVFEQCCKTLPPSEPQPTPRLFLAAPLLQQLVMSPPDTQELKGSDLQPMVDNFAALYQEWRARVSQNLLGLLHERSAMPKPMPKNPILEAPNALDLATTVFICKECHLEPITPLRAMSHACIYCSGYDHTDNETLQGRMLYHVFEERAWNVEGMFTANADVVKLVGDVVQMCGFDRETTTRAQMDKVYPIIECLTCHSDVQGRVVMPWWAVVHHWTAKHAKEYYHGYNYGQTPVMKLRVVTDIQDAARIRTELAVQREKDEMRDDLSICAECHHKGSRADLKRHWRNEHGRIAKDGDIVPQLDVCPYRGDYYCWPPWEDEEYALLDFEEVKVTKGAGD